MVRTPLALFLVGLLLHAMWAATIPLPEDWDPAYYREVASRIAAGEGAVSGVVWNLLAPPSALPAPADVYWMPLPSRVLVPALWLWPAHGDQLMAVLFAAAWGPLAWALARELGANDRAALLAGVFAVAGGPYARSLSTPDSFAVYGVLGGIGLWAVARDKLGWAAAVAVLAALTRNDGFLFGMALGLGFGRRGLIVGWAGLVATAAWHARNLALVGEDYLIARRATARAMSYADVIAGNVPEVGLGTRLATTASYLPEVVIYWGNATMAVTLPFVVYAAWTHREQALVRVVGAYFVAMPLVTHLLAPAVAAHGTVYRSGAAIYPALCALAAIGLMAVSRLAVDKRDYPPWMLPSLVGGGFVLGTLLLGASRIGGKPPPDCAVIAETEGVIFHWDALLARAHCGRDAVILPRHADPAQLAELAERYDVRFAVVAPEDQLDEGSARLEDAKKLLPEWELVGERTLRRP